MSQSEKLSQRIEQHKIKNKESKEMDKDVIICKNILIDQLKQDYNNSKIIWQKKLYISKVIKYLKNTNPEIDHSFFYDCSNREENPTFISPDMGILFVDGNICLIGEAKKQGTNKERENDGKKKQAKGNAIERLGKNLTLTKAVFRKEKILPFFCYGYGCDFENSSSILDRVVSINETFALNKIFVYNIGDFEPCSLFFREEKWDIEEIVPIIYDITKQSIEYYNFLNIKNKHILLLGDEK